MSLLSKLLKKSSPSKPQKVVVLGIDGVPCSLLKRFISEGIMPNFAALSKKGTLTKQKNLIKLKRRPLVLVPLQ